MDRIQDIRIEGDAAVIEINTALFPLDIIYSAAYVMTDKAYILLDGDPASRIIAIIRSKQDDDPKGLAIEFSDQLLNYAVYKNQANKNSAIKQAIIQRVLLTNGYEIPNDPEQIENPNTEDLIPWEDHHADKPENSRK